jgi:hypothetical protein
MNKLMDLFTLKVEQFLLEITPLKYLCSVMWRRKNQGLNLEHMLRSRESLSWGQRLVEQVTALKYLKGGMLL